MTHAALATLAALVAFAFLVETAAGFGSMVVALTLGALWFEVNALLAWIVPVNLVLSSWLVIQGRSSLDKRFLFRRMLPAMTLGLLFGSVVAHQVSGLSLKIAFGLLVVVLSAWQLFQLHMADSNSKPMNRSVRIVALISAGVIHGIFGSGGPLAVFVASRELNDKATFRTTLSALWLMLNLMLVVRLGIEHSLTFDTLQISAVLLIPLVIGIAIGEWLHRKLEERQFRFAVSGLLVIAGLVLVVSSLGKAQ